MPEIMRRKSQSTRWSRRLTGIPGVDFVTCRICGDRRQVISGWHLSKHETDRLTYMEEHELSRDQLVAKGFRGRLCSRILAEAGGILGLPREPAAEPVITL